MLPNVRILIQNGALGSVAAFADGVAAFCTTGVAVTDKIQIADPRVVFSLEEAETIGITLAGNPTMYKVLKQFYKRAGTGAECYIMIVADTMEQTEMLDNTNANGVKKLLDFAGGRIRLLGTSFLPPGGYTLTTTAGIDADCYTAMTNANVLAKAYADAQMPLAIIIEGRAFTGNAANLTDISALTNDYVGIVIGDDVSGASSCVGLVIGAAAALPVQRKISRVKNGSLPISSAYVGTAKVDTYASIGLIHDKGFITIRKFPTLGGYYFSSDRLAAGASSDFSKLARRRVINKAAVIAYSTYVEEVDDEVLIKEDGTLDDGVVKYLEGKIENQINLLMTANKEISSVTAYINPAQNVLSANKTKVVLKIVPVGYNEAIDVELGFDNPAIS